MQEAKGLGFADRDIKSRLSVGDKRLTVSPYGFLTYQPVDAEYPLRNAAI
jgi:hypothetical protein